MLPSIRFFALTADCVLHCLGFNPVSVMCLLHLVLVGSVANFGGPISAQKENLEI